jgi:hypothetical protein
LPVFTASKNVPCIRLFYHQTQSMTSFELALDGDHFSANPIEIIF